LLILASVLGALIRDRLGADRALLKCRTKAAGQRPRR
jgi:hypothetical protein